MTAGKVLLRDATGQEQEAWPVDAREMIASGGWEPADSGAARIREGLAAFPMLSRQQPVKTLLRDEAPYMAPPTSPGPTQPALDSPPPDAPRRPRRAPTV